MVPDSHQFQIYWVSVLQLNVGLAAICRFLHVVTLPTRMHFAVVVRMIHQITKQEKNRYVQHCWLPVVVKPTILKYSVFINTLSNTAIGAGKCSPCTLLSRRNVGTFETSASWSLYNVLFDICSFRFSKSLYATELTKWSISIDQPMAITHKPATERIGAKKGRFFEVEY